MHWKEKIKWAIERVLNDDQDDTRYLFIFNSEDSFRIEASSCQCGNLGIVYECCWGDLASHWKDAISKCLLSIMQQRINDVMKDLEEKDPA